MLNGWRHPVHRLLTQGRAQADLAALPAATASFSIISTMTNKKGSSPFSKKPLCIGRDDWIRTSDLTHPKRARYQAAPRPVIFTISVSAETFFCQIRLARLSNLAQLRQVCCAGTRQSFTTQPSQLNVATVHDVQNLPQVRGNLSQRGALLLPGSVLVFRVGLFFRRFHSRVP